MEIIRTVVRLIREVFMLKKFKFFVFSDKTLNYRVANAALTSVRRVRLKV